jgi:type I restriction enzyme M protein
VPPAASVRRGFWPSGLPAAGIVPIGDGMLTGEIRNQIDSIWNDFWAGGVANPLSVIEQITYLLFIKRLDELHTLEERKSQALKQPMERRIFPAGKDDQGRPWDDLRWSRFKHFEARAMMAVVDERVFPFLRTLGAEGSSYGQHMKDARLDFSSPALLFKVVEKLDRIPMENRDTKGDVYEYMLGKIATAGQNGQFRTPRHIISGRRRRCSTRNSSPASCLSMPMPPMRMRSYGSRALRPDGPWRPRTA